MLQCGAGWWWPVEGCPDPSCVWAMCALSMCRGGVLLGHHTAHLHPCSTSAWSQALEDKGPCSGPRATVHTLLIVGPCKGGDVPWRIQTQTTKVKNPEVKLRV